MDKSLVRRLQRLEDPWRKAPGDVIAGLERQLAEARADASACCDGYEGQISMLQAILRDTQNELAEARAMLHEKGPALTGRAKVRGVRLRRRKG